MNIHEFWQAVLTQDRAALSTYFTDDAIIRWRCTNEQFTVSEFIRANCAYPGKWDGEVERVENTESGVVLAGRVFPTDRSCSCHVVSFLRMRDDKISEMDEYWSDDGDAPQWRKEMKIGKAIPCCLGAERDNPTRAPARAESAAPLRRHRSEHHRQLDPEPFDRIKSGQKTIELRLLDEKRR